MKNKQGKTKQVGKITDAAINIALKNPAIEQIKDNRHPLYLKINAARDGGSWVLIHYINNDEKKHVLGKWPAINAATIESKIALIRLNLSLDATAETAVGSLAYCEELLTWYSERLQGSSDHSKSRKKAVKSAVNKHLSPMLQDVLISELSPEIVDKLIFSPLQQSRKLSTVRSILGILKAAFSQAFKIKMIEQNPLSEVTFTDFTTKKIKAAEPLLFERNIEPLLQGLGKLPSDNPDIQAMQLLVLLMLCHGTRIGETRRTRWYDFDLRANNWHIPASHTKNGLKHNLPITPIIKQLLIAYKENQQLSGYGGVHLFPGQPRACITAEIANEFIQVVSDRRWTAHHLRKLFGTSLADVGIDLAIREELLNHEKSDLDKAYIHTYMLVQCRLALEKYHKWLDGYGLSTTIINITKHRSEA